MGIGDVGLGRKPVFNLHSSPPNPQPPTPMTRFLLLALALTTAASAQTTRAVFVGNQGTPATVTYVDRAAGTAQPIAGVTLSTYLQGMAVIGDRLYVTGNGSRIDVVDVTTRQRVGQITDAAFGTSRYIAGVAPGKAYVTVQNYATGATAAEVVVLDLATNTVSRRIAIPLQPEGLALAGGRVYVTLGAFGGSTRLAVIDPATDTVLPAVEIGCTARFVFGDDDGEAVVVCTDSGEFVRIDGATGAVTGRDASGATLSSAFGIGQDAALVRTASSTEQTLVAVTSTGVLTYGTDTHAVTSRVTIADVATRPISAVGFDAQRSQFILGRPDATGPFSSNGTITVHSLTGALVATNAAGVFPAYVAVDVVGGVASEGGPSASGLRLAAAVPNPASTTTEVRFSLDAPQTVSVVLMDVLGREVARVADGAFGVGEQRVALNVRALPAGVYVVRLVAGGSVATQRLTVTR